MKTNHGLIIGPLCIKLPQMIGYVKCFDSPLGLLTIIY